MEIPIITPIINHLFPVIIYDQGDKLTIEDRRPTVDLILTFSGLVLSLIFLAWSVWTLIGQGIYWPTIVLAIVTALLIYRSLTRFYREVYVFDKTKNAYYFGRQSVLRSDVIEGDLRQFRAVQIEHTVTSTDGGSVDLYRVVLLLNSDLLLGASPSQPIRQQQTTLSDWETEARIASAISKFLGIRLDSQVDVMAFN